MQNSEPFTIEIAGGLGNQLFMFYAGLYFQEKFKREVIFDVSDLPRVQKLHPGENIQTLGLLADFQTTSRISTTNYNLNRMISGFMRITGTSLPRRIFSSDEIGFIDLSLIPFGVTRISGYFQSWVYFNSLREKPILSLKNLSSPTDWLSKNIERAKTERVLSLHVRRGDYALPANRMNGILSRSYYEKALINIGDYDSIWIFTDSPNEVKEEFSDFGYPFEIVTPPSNSDPVESLLLMAETQKIVISNSSYSWWSATIAGDAASIYAPSKWYELRVDPSKLIPHNWKRIPSEWAKQ